MNGTGSRPQPIPLRSMTPPPPKPTITHWWGENYGYVLLLVALYVVFWLATGDTIMRWLWGVS